MKKLCLISLAIVLVIALVSGLSLASCEGPGGETPTPPSAPTGLTCNAVSSYQIDLSWDPCSGATGYKIYRCFGSFGTTCTPTTLLHTESSTPWSNTGLTAGTTYRYRVTAYNEAGESGYSATVSCTPGVYDALWIAYYNTRADFHDYASAMAVDAVGNVYVTGRSKGTDMWNDYATIKYNTNGDELWVRRYNGPGMYTDEAHAIAIDNSGNVYVTGNSYSSETNFDYATIKYDQNGNELWVARYTGPGDRDDYARAIAVDNSGNVYVTGYIRNSGEPWTRNDYATIKYDSNGNELWVRIYDGYSQPDFLDDEACAIAVDAYGNVYVTGRSAYGSIFAYDYDYLTIKYDSSGNLLWAKRYDGLGEDDDYAFDIAVDDLGNVYVTGASEGDGTFYDYTTIKYDPNGTLLWLRRYNGPGNDGDQASAIAVDGSGNVYVTGVSGGIGTSGDYATIKYGSDGEVLWVERYNGPGNGMDWPSAMAIDDSGNVYVTGRSEGEWTGADYATIKYDTNGNELWVRRYELGVSEEAVDIALDGLGNVYVTGTALWGATSDYVTIKYSG